jgi:hypothetical protein
MGLRSSGFLLRLSAIVFFLLISLPAFLQQPGVRVNIYGGSFPAGPGWNNWNVQADLNLNTIYYADGSRSPFTASLSVSNAVGDNGADYPVTMCPVEVGRTTSYSTMSRFLVLSGLDNSKTYELELYASRNNTGNSTQFRIGTQSIVIATDKNLADAAVFSRITPAGGVIRVDIERLNTYNYLNGFVLRETSLAPPNNIPVASAGQGQTITLPVSSVVLNGNASYDPDGAIISYRWRRVSGPGNAGIVQPDSAVTTVSGLEQGIHLFQLTVKDNSGDSATANVQVTVLGPVSLPPLGADSINCGKVFKIVVLGSSTAMGTGATPIDSSWVNKLRRYVRSKNNQSTVIHYIQHALPDRFCASGQPSLAGYGPQYHQST